MATWKAASNPPCSNSGRCRRGCPRPGRIDAIDAGLRAAELIDTLVALKHPRVVALSIDGDDPVLPAAIWVLGFVSLLMDISSEMIHSPLPLFMVGTLGASALVVGLVVLIAADLVLASGTHWATLLAGVTLGGLLLRRARP